MLKVAVLTVSDRCSRGECRDESGKVIIDIINKSVGRVVQYDIIPDERDMIEEKIIGYCDHIKVDFVLTTGGTGLAPRDVTPEATRNIADKIIPGISEFMRLEGLKSTKNSILSRGISAVRNRTVIINFPGSPKGAKESLLAILDIIPHAFDMLRGGGHQ
ncbi:MAG: MogA/MoaB family molybdenum cofactor biosynthesis protein [Candidatus Omnitrophota bacterium]